MAIKRLGNGVLLFPIAEPWQLVNQALDMFEADIELERQQPDTQIRLEISK